MSKSEYYDYIFDKDKKKQKEEPEEKYIVDISRVRLSKHKTTRYTPVCSKHKIEFIKRIRDGKEHFICDLCKEEKEFERKERRLPMI